jgi:hypothetical protein
MQFPTICGKTQTPPGATIDALVRSQRRQNPRDGYFRSLARQPHLRRSWRQMTPPGAGAPADRVGRSGSWRRRHALTALEVVSLAEVLARRHRRLRPGAGRRVGGDLLLECREICVRRGRRGRGLRGRRGGQGQFARARTGRLRLGSALRLRRLRAVRLSRLRRRLTGDLRGRRRRRCCLRRRLSEDLG